MKKKVLRFVVAILAVVTLTACSTTKTNTSSSKSEASSSSSSASAVSSSSSSAPESSNSSAMFDLVISAAQSQIPAQMEQFKDMYSNMTITGENGDTVVYTMTFINHVGVMDSAALKPVFAEGVKSVFSSLKAVIADPKIQAIYLNPDGSEAANVTITQADIDALG